MRQCARCGQLGRLVRVGAMDGAGTGAVVYACPGHAAGYPPLPGTDDPIGLIESVARARRDRDAAGR